MTHLPLPPCLNVPDVRRPDGANAVGVYSSRTLWRGVTSAKNVRLTTLLLRLVRAGPSTLKVASSLRPTLTP